MDNDTIQNLPSGTIIHGEAYDYKIIRMLGSGSFGITYLAKVEMRGALGTINSDMYVAVKEFFMKDINGREGSSVTCSTTTTHGLADYYRDKFEQEARHLSTLKHPNIVGVVESFHGNNTVYYVMEYVSGMSLDDMIAVSPKGHLDDDKAIDITMQVGKALTLMHNNGMLHLDVKPGNIMIKDDGTAVLIDFGLSKQYDENDMPESSTRIGAGTPGYAPLEQANYHADKGLPVVMDVYALGGTLYKMLTGQRPPEASEIFNDGFPLHTLLAYGASKALSACVQKAMSPMKKDRYASISDFMQALSLCRHKPMTAANDEATTVSTSIDRTPDSSTAEPTSTSPRAIIQPQDRPKSINLGKRILGIITSIAAIYLVVVAIYAISHPRTQTDTDEQATAGDTIAQASGIKYADKSGSYTWDGDADINGIPQGTGTATFDSDDSLGRAVYTGNMSDGVRDDNGKAIQTFRDGRKYVGTFDKGLYGEGTLYMPNERQAYTGTFKGNHYWNGELHEADANGKPGKRICRYKDGQVVYKSDTSTYQTHPTAPSSNQQTTDDDDDNPMGRSDINFDDL